MRVAGKEFVKSYFKIRMSIVTISKKFQIVIPKAIRDKMKLQSGIQCEVVSHGSRILLIPLPPIEEMRGFLKGIDSTVIREKDRV